MVKNCFFLSWFDFFGDSEPIDIKKSEILSQEPFRPTRGDTHVYDCSFLNLHSPSDGGAIFFSIAKSKILVEKSLFKNCSTESYTGAIKVTRGDAVFCRICGSDCAAAYRDGFSSITDDTSIKISSFFDSSISHCEAQTYSVYHRYGHIRIKSLNISHNKADSISALRCAPSQVDENSFGTFINYCSFANNTSNENSICLSDLYYDNCQHEIKNSNIPS